MPASTFVAGRVVAARHGAGQCWRPSPSGRRAAIAAGLVIDATGRPSAVARRLGAQRLVSDRLIAERRRELRTGPDACWLDVKRRSRQGWSYPVSGPDGRRERWIVHRPEQRSMARARVARRCIVVAAVAAAGDGWIAIGDAAAAFDPVTSQGLANALSTALVAAGAILSPDGLDDGACRIYSDAVATTFHHSEAGRAKVYAALAGNAAAA